MSFPARKRGLKGLERILPRLSQLSSSEVSQVAQKLSEERTLLEAVVQSLQEAVIVIDSFGGIEIINNAAEKILGLEDFHVRPKDRPQLWRAAPQLAALLNVNSDGSLTLLAPLSHQLQIHYPQERIAKLYAAPLGGRILIVLSDETSRHADSARQIEEARLNSVTQLAAGVAHELGNPLNALQIHLQLIERALKKDKKASSDKKIVNSLATAQNEVARLDLIIRNFLQALRPTPLHLQPTDLPAVLQETVHFLSPELQGAGIRVEVVIPAVPPTVMADAQQVRQVYFNIIKNAREACPSGGALRIEVTSTNENVILRFIDSGTGMREDDLLHLFEPYHTTKPGGTGLGMMIAQKIMRAHHGSIAVASSPGQGTTVTLSFPRQHRRLQALPSTVAPALPTPPKRK